MDEKRALEIIKSLADGIDPSTGEILPKDSPYQNVEIVRALHKAQEALKRAIIVNRKVKIKQTETVTNCAGRLWNKEETAILARQFDSGIPIAEIAKLHHRTETAIAARLVRIGKVSSRDEARIGINH